MQDDATRRDGRHRHIQIPYVPAAVVAATIVYRARRAGKNGIIPQLVYTLLPNNHHQVAYRRAPARRREQDDYDGGVRTRCYHAR